MHFQRAPHAEMKVVRCVRGAIHDVIIDMRPETPTYRRWEGFDLTAETGRMLYVPAGFAHGFQTLQDDTDVAYQVSHPYTPGAEGGFRWDDPAFAIAWPLPVALSRTRTQAGPGWSRRGMRPILGDRPTHTPPVFLLGRPAPPEAPPVRDRVS